jgi:hypothetical protein
MFAVDLGSFRLPVRCERTSFDGSFIGFKTQPSKRPDNIVFCSLYISDLVRVFDAEYELAASLSGQEVVIKSCPDAANV